MHEVKRRIKDEIKKIEQKGITTSNAQYLQALVKSLKDLEEIEYFDVAEEAMMRGESAFREYAHNRNMGSGQMHGDMMRERHMPVHGEYSNTNMGFRPQMYSGGEYGTDDKYSRFEDARRKYHIQRNPRTRSEMMNAFHDHLDEQPHMAEHYEMNHDDEEIRDAARRYRRRR